MSLGIVAIFLVVVVLTLFLSMPVRRIFGQVLRTASGAWSAASVEGGGLARLPRLVVHVNDLQIIVSATSAGGWRSVSRRVQTYASAQSDRFASGTIIVASRINTEHTRDLPEQATSLPIQFRELFEVTSSSSKDDAIGALSPNAQQKIIEFAKELGPLDISLEGKVFTVSLRRLILDPKAIQIMVNSFQVLAPFFYQNNFQVAES